MGMLQDAVNQFDNSDKNADAISATLDLMVELTKTKAELFKEQITENLNRGRILGKGDSADSLYFPISSVKDSRLEYRCIAKDKPTGLVDTISKAISGMIDDHSGKGIVKGVASIIDGGLNTLMGLSEGTEQYTSSTSTFIDGKGVAVNIVRFDTIIWGRAIKASSIKDKIRITLACVAYKSVVDVTQITFDDFRSVYAPVMEASGEKDVMKAIKKAREVYNILDGGTALKKNAPKEMVLANDIRETKTLNKSHLSFCSDVLKVEDAAF